MCCETARCWLLHEQPSSLMTKCKSVSERSFFVFENRKDVKLFYAHHEGIRMEWGADVQLHSFLTSTLVGGDLLASRLLPHYPSLRTPVHSE